jgi:hypothetical protein
MNGVISSLLACIESSLRLERRKPKTYGDVWIILVIG